MSTPSTNDSARPRLSAIVPTFSRPDLVEALLKKLDEQTLAPEQYEVIVVDDGSPEPIALDEGAHAYHLKLLRQENAGPGAARNLAIAHCRAPITLILNDDAVPAPDLLEKHLEAQASAPPMTAVLGTFTFTERARLHPFVQLLEDTDLLFTFRGLRDGERHDWRFFWTCNISLSTAALRQVGGFDADRFREAAVEDVELGYRLEQLGWRTLYLEDLRCEHDHVIDADTYLRRLTRLGANLARLYLKHQDEEGCWQGTEIGPSFRAALQANVERHHPQLMQLRETLAKFEQAFASTPVDPTLKVKLVDTVQELGRVNVHRGMLEELEGHDPGLVLSEGQPEGKLTSVIVISHDCLDKTQRCLEALRAVRDERHPTEILFVDNGSTDGSAEYLAEQPDVELIHNAMNLGAPRARNQAIARARGDWLVFMDNDVMVTPGWLRRLLWHGEVDGSSGCIGPMSDRAAHGQQVTVPVPDDPLAIERFAESLAVTKHREFRSSPVLTSFCVLVRRAVIEAIGGFDERFSPWGFEDDDFTLRAMLAGFRNRVALDTFVRHESYGGPKAAWHSSLLERNWSRFAEKWAGNGDLSYGDYAGLGTLAPGRFSGDQLLVPVEGQTVMEHDDFWKPGVPVPQLVGARTNVRSVGVSS